MLPDSFGRTFENINKLQEINETLVNLNLKKKEVSRKIIESTKIKNQDLRNAKIEELLKEISEIEKEISAKENEKKFPS